MPLYLLHKKGYYLDPWGSWIKSKLAKTVDFNPWEYPEDKMHAILVRESSPKSARKLVAGSRCVGDEKAKVWLDPKFTTCKKMKEEGNAKIIIKDFYAG